MASASHALFPSTGLQVLSCLIYLIGTTIISHCLSRRLYIEHIKSLSTIRQIPWARICVLLILIVAWIFLVTSGTLVLGVGLEKSRPICDGGIFVCIFCYATVKVLVYLFLMERVWIVWGPTSGGERFKSPLYLLCSALVSGQAAIFAMMIARRVTFIRQNGQCVIGLGRESALPLMVYDLCISIFFTLLFVWPLVHSTADPRIRKLAKRALFAASVALGTTTVNMAVLTALWGSEAGWVCLGCCNADIIFNALAVFWVTSAPVSAPQHQVRPNSVKFDEHFTTLRFAGQVETIETSNNHNNTGPASPMKVAFKDNVSEKATCRDRGSRKSSVVFAPFASQQSTMQSISFEPAMIEQGLDGDAEKQSTAQRHDDYEEMGSLTEEVTLTSNSR